MIFKGISLNFPVHYELGDSDTNNILNLFYADKSRWSYLSQTHFLANRAQRMLKQKHGKYPLLLIDRSIYGDRIFADLLHDQGYMSKEEYNTYKKFHTTIVSYFPKPSLLVYIDCSIDAAFNRIIKRNRECENSIEYCYLERLNNKYKEWFNEYNYSPKIKIDSEKINFCVPEGEFVLTKLIKDKINEIYEN